MHRFYLRRIVANVYTWNPYLHTCNPNLLTSGLSLPTAIAAATAAATIAAAATRFFQKIIVSLKSICLVTSRNRGTTPTRLIFSLGFKTTRNLSTLLIFEMPDLVLISPTGMHLISIPLVMGHLNTTMFHVSFLSSVGDTDLERSDRRIEYFNSRTLKNHAGTDI